MPTDATSEKAYYESRYATFLDLPDGELRFTPEQFLADLEDPGKEVYERRELYRATLDALSRMELAGRAVLDYGCGTGDFGLWMASAERASVTFLDLSENAVDVCLRRAAASGIAERCDGVARDAADLSCFADASFDLVYGCASLHHTIKYSGAWSELLRVLKPGGALVLTETFGNNPVLNALRRWNWRREGLAEEQGEDVIFNEEHVAVLRKSFAHVDLRPMGILAMAKRAMRGRFQQPLVRGALAGLRAADTALVAALPPLNRYCGEVLVIATGRR